MTCGACRRKPCSRVIGIGRALIVGFVARRTIRRHGCVVVVHVAIGTGHGGVRSSQRERGVVVVKARRLPCRRVMAKIASLREA